MKKICSKCGIEKDATEFCKNRRCSDGLQNWCKSCKEEYRRKYYENNLEKERESKRKWRENNPEKARESARESKRKWRENNPEEVRAKNRKWREDNLEKERERNRASIAKARSELADVYVKQKLKQQFGIPAEEIDSEFIRDKRESIAVKREIRQLKKQLKLQQNG